ncbi:MFS transporter [Chachezhania sediminis]|uniref:MFS transporter n=1 Tax=Chachezhania sediminis TaxID=2599291 RepID=UPI00131D7F98|nr:MFS transporter [Chachezhania sediminis]
MIQVLSSAWALLLGLGLLTVGNGLQTTVLGLRGEMEGFSTLDMSFIILAYYAGFLGGSRAAPELIRRVGHVRVFAALASGISAVMIVYPVLPEPVVWILGRALVGFCFSGVYVVAESWLNNAADNANRGKALSLYMAVMMIGMISSQGLVLVSDPGGYVGFVIASVLVSISFTPILLSISPTPPFDTTKPMPLKTLFKVSPLGCVGTFMVGGVISAQYGMAAVFGAVAQLTVAEISIFIAMFYVGALLMQFPLGWMSDRVDRRMLILALSLLGGGAAIAGYALGDSFAVLLVVAFLSGGTANPLYSLLIAYTNDYLGHEDMAAASGGLLFLNGLGASVGPLLVGWLMGPAVLGPAGYFVYMAVLMVALAVYAAYRATQRAAVPVEETGAMMAVTAITSPIAVEVAQEVVIEAELEAAEEAAQEEQSAAGSS